MHEGDQDAQDQADADGLDEQFAALGIAPDGEVHLEADPVFYLWPDNEPAWRFFLQCRTQWRHGFSGETGLDYAGVESLMGQLHVARRRRAKLWALVRAAETGFLLGRSQLPQPKPRG